MAREYPAAFSGGGTASQPRSMTPGLKGSTVRVNSGNPSKPETTAPKGPASAPRNITPGTTPNTVRVNSNPVRQAGNSTTKLHPDNKPTTGNK